jgi:hypothetical protein
MLPWDCIGLYAHAQELPFHENPHSKEMGTKMFTIHTSIIKIQIMISIEIHAFNKVIYVHGY